ncbi:MAG: pyrroline-5-carboxylate reductase [Geobacter sp.]|nr:pyrroline-5-carboxylate reductase [Geobacter sp.]
MLRNRKIGFIGGGNMAEAIIKGLVAGGMDPAAITVGEPSTERQKHLAGQYGISTTAENAAVVTACDVVILAIKPQVALGVMGGVASYIREDQLFISIMAGIGTAAIEEAIPRGKVVRVMPNTPALVLQGASAICCGSRADADDLELTRAIFDRVGKTWVVEEKLMDAVTGLSGSGPAYVFTFIESLSDAGVKNGLPRDIATGLAAQTVFGSAALLMETGEHSAMLRDRVTSPGGTTIAGLHQLEASGFRAAVINAVDAATARSKELGKK